MSSSPATIYRVNESVLRQIADLHPELGLDSAAWASAHQAAGQQVALYRDYRSGAHRNFLTTKQRKMINLPPAVPSTRRRATSTVSNHDFNSNYCHKVVTTVAARTKVEDFIFTSDSDANTKTLNEWQATLKQQNRFNSLQKRAYISAFGDRECFVLADWDDDLDQVTWSLESAYDGIDGMLVEYLPDHETPLFGVKIWQVSGHQSKFTQTRVNLYFPYHVERFITTDSGDLQPYPDEVDFIIEWAIGKVPIASFINRREAFTSVGKSEIADIIGLQDALNYALYSMTASSTMTGFGLYELIGHAIPDVIQPGMVFAANQREVAEDGTITVSSPVQSDGVNTFFKPEVRRVAGEGPGPYVEQANWLIEQISVITDTPVPQFMGGSGESGEALKQRDIGLIAKTENAQVEFGDAWEDLWVLSHLIQDSFGGDTLPPLIAITTRWKPAELRSGTALIEAVVQLKGSRILDAQTALEAVAFVFNWTAEDITKIVERLGAEASTALFGAQNQIPGVTPNNGLL